jgi:hypothetical protein
LFEKDLEDVMAKLTMESSKEEPGGKSKGKSGDKKVKTAKKGSTEESSNSGTLPSLPTLKMREMMSPKNQGWGRTESRLSCLMVVEAPLRFVREATSSQTSTTQGSQGHS